MEDVLYLLKGSGRFSMEDHAFFVRFPYYYKNKK